MSRLSGDFPVQLATRPYLIGRPAVRCGVVLPVCPCVVSFSKVHERDTRDLLRASSRGCREDATRKLLPWNSSFTGRSNCWKCGELRHRLVSGGPGDGTDRTQRRINLHTNENIAVCQSHLSTALQRDKPQNMYGVVASQYLDTDRYIIACRERWHPVRCSQIRPLYPQQRLQNIVVAPLTAIKFNRIEC